MRFLVLAAVLVLAQLGAAWAAGDPDTARPGGAFLTVPADCPDACARRCADDGLCLAWDFQNGSCELKAIVPAAVPHTGATSGLSLRAPVSLRRLAPRPTPTAESTTPETSTAAEDDISDQLLGGAEAPGSLRARLGN